MICYAVKMPHKGLKPGADLNRLMFRYIGLMRCQRGIAGLYHNANEDWTYALFKSETDAQRCMTRVGRIMGFEYAGKQEIEKEKVKRCAKW